MEIKTDDLSSREIAAFLREHMSDMRAVSPPESVHALELESLKATDITFWSCWEKGELIGCAAIKQLDFEHAEIKSMRIKKAHRGKGFASQLLSHIITIAQSRRYVRISLETGSMSYFEPAVSLYKKYGFQVCGPFSYYKLDSNSLFMTKVLSNT